jgi:ABC-type tungstate transport system permease subunit
MHFETIGNEMIQILNEFSNISIIYDNFYLAGGTGLALQLGHRKSLDLDFFSEKKFNAEIIASTVTKINGKITSRVSHPNKI